MQKPPIKAAGLASILFISVAAGTYWWSHNQPSPTFTPTPIIAGANPSREDSKSTTNKIATDATYNNSSSADGPYDGQLDMAARLQQLKPAYNAWRHAHGYGTDDADGTPLDYLNYSDAQLHQLMSQGDMFAYQLFAKRKMSQSEDVKLDYIKTKALYYQAAVLGSTYALAELEVIDTNLSIAYRNTKPDLSRKYRQDAQAWAEVRTLRNELLNFHLRKALNAEPINPSERAETQQQAQAIFADLIQQRRVQNLPEFDNSPAEFEQVIIAEAERLRSQP